MIGYVSRFLFHIRDSYAPSFDRVYLAVKEFPYPVISRLSYLPHEISFYVRLRPFFPLSLHSCVYRTVTAVVRGALFQKCVDTLSF